MLLCDFHVGFTLQVAAKSFSILSHPRQGLSAYANPDLTQNLPVQIAAFEPNQKCGMTLGLVSLSSECPKCGCE